MEDLNHDNSKFKDGVNKNARLIIRNISFKASEDALREHFARFGTVEEVKLLKKPDGRLVGCGFVHFTHVPMATKALAATNKKPFLGRPISVSWAVPQYKFVEQIKNDGLDKKRVHCDPIDEEKKLRVKENIKDEPESIKDDKNKVRINRNARLVVRNVSFKATEDSLKEHFAPYGEIQEVKLLKKPDGKLVGCAFVHFKNVPMAKKALLSTNMKPYLGRPISVDWAVAKNKYMQFVVNQQLDLQDDVKKEESDSDDDGLAFNTPKDEMKAEIKSESEDNSENESASEQEFESGEEEDDEEEEDEIKDEQDEDGNADDAQSETSTQAERPRIKLNDAEDGCTVFLTNLSFDVDDGLLRQFAENTGPVKYALVCVDKLTEHSKGSGFVKFVNKEDADKFLALPPEQLRLEGQTVQVKPALKKENLVKASKQPKDNRNLYLVKEGVVVAGTKAAVGLSSSDMTKRLALERSKTQMLKNLNRFVSRYRLVVANLPPNFDDGKLRSTCTSAVGKRAEITECRVMRDLRAPVGPDGRHPSKGFGFVMFTRHEDALACLRKLNNNPDIFDRNNRPIVSFSIEDRIALNARKKRLEKSIANNPLNKEEQDESSSKKRNRKRKNKTQPDESYVKKARFDQNKKQHGNSQKNFSNNRDQTPGKFVRRAQDIEAVDYAGITAREGSQHNMRSNQKLRAQADTHRQNVKIEKKRNKRTLLRKKAMKERIKLPKQKMNKNPNNKKRRSKKPTPFYEK